MTNCEPPEQPEEAKDYPAPSIERVETEGNEPGEPSSVAITVEYWSHRCHGHAYEATVHYRILDGMAKLRNVEGGGRYVDQFSPIIVTIDAVQDVPGVEDVRTIMDEFTTAIRFVQQCKSEVSEE